LHLNVQGGLIDKITDLEVILDGSNILIICLNEHWLAKDNIGFLNSLNNNNLAHFYCRENSGHGGSCILVNSNLEYKTREYLCIFSSDSVFEMSCVEVIALKIIVISIYRVPDDSNLKLFLNKLEDLLTLLNTFNQVNNVYTTADFNIDVLESTNKPQQRFEFLSLIKTYGFQTNFASPTRIANNNGSCIDNILSLKLKSGSENLTMNLELGLSDHRAILMDISSNVSSQLVSAEPRIKRRIFSKKNIDFFVNQLNITNWHVLPENSLNDNITNFFGFFQNIFDESFPLKFFFFYKNKPSNKKKWITTGIKISSIKKRELSRQAKQSTDVNFINYVKEYKKIFRKVCKLSKQMYNSSIINNAENKSKAAWEVVKSELGCKNHVGTFLIS